MGRRDVTLPALLTLAVGTASLACNSPNRAEPPGQPSSLSSTSPQDVDPNWPPRYLFHFVGYEVPNGAIQEAFGLAVDDTYAYWFEYDNKYMRVDKSAPSSDAQVVYPGATGSQYALGLDGGYFYALDHASVLRIAASDLATTSLTLKWDHSAGGALLIGSQYVYAAMPGCAAVTRIDKSTLKSEVMTIDGVNFPGRGYTYLAQTEAGLLCVSPSTIYRIDTWGMQPTVVYNQLRDVFGAVVVGQGVYWIEQHENSGEEQGSFIGCAPIAGGGGGIVAKDSEGTMANRLLYVPSIQRILYAALDGIRAFNPATNTVATLVKSGRTNDIAVDGNFAYGSALGRRLHEYDGSVRSDSAFWITQVPLAELAQDPPGTP
jgi:hypothetical protein